MSQTNNLPAVSFSQGGTPALPDNVMQSMAAMYGEMFNGLGGANMRRIKVRKTDFLLIDGQNQEAVPADQMVGVLVGSSPHNHAVWYQKDYVPGQEPEAPDLTWLMPTPDTFPDALPVQFRSKINRNGAERWAFQILRRLAFALIRNVNGNMVLDLERPYIMDLSSMSLFGKGLPEQNMFKWGGIRDVCNQHSVPGLQVTPSMFMTQIIIDPNTSVNGVVLFRPMRDQHSGQLQFLDSNLIMAVHECAQKQSTRDMLTIREKLTYDGAASAAAAPQAQTAPPAGQVMDPSLLAGVAPAQMPPQQPMQQPPVQTATQPAAPLNMTAGFGTAPVTPEQQVANAPSTPIQAPQQVAAPATAPVQNASTQTLLAQAAQVLGQQNTAAPSAPPAGVVNTAQAVSGVGGQVPLAGTPTPAAAAPVGATDPSVEASISGLLAALN